MTTPVTAGSSRADINSKRPPRPDMIHFRGKEVDQHEVTVLVAPSLLEVLDLEQGRQIINFASARIISLTNRASKLNFNSVNETEIIILIHDSDLYISKL